MRQRMAHRGAADIVHFGQCGLGGQRRAQVVIIDTVNHLVNHIVAQVLGSAHASLGCFLSI
ncbi:hypothetical protein D3C71_2166340 [compost metagenome]